MSVVAISDKVVHGITMETSLGKRKKMILQREEIDQVKMKYFRV